MANNKEILIKRSNEVVNGAGKLPQPSDLQYGELAINYANGHESLSFKNDGNEVVTLGMNVKQTTGEDEMSPAQRADYPQHRPQQIDTGVEQFDKQCDQTY